MNQSEHQKKKKEFLESYEEFSDAIFRHCYFRVSDRERALDLTQDTFVKTWEYIVKGKKVVTLKSFLYKVANNLIIDHYRKKKSSSLDTLEEEAGVVSDTSSEQELFRGVEARHVFVMIKRLSDGDQKIILLRYAEDLSPKEIADIIGTSENAASVRITRAIDKLKKILHSEEKDI